MNFFGFGSAEKVDSVDKGAGFVHEHSVEIGKAVIVFNNIGSFVIQDGRKAVWPIGLGFILFIAGLPALSQNGLAAGGLALMALGAVLFIAGCLWKRDLFLSIGTSDGRQTRIVSKNREFLLRVQRLLRDKIDDRMLTAKIDISAQTITGGIAIGANPVAAGAQGHIYTEMTHE